jgi:hypothetical protein
MIIAIASQKGGVGKHTAASLMLNYGIPVLIVSKRPGHSKPSNTIDVYGHLILSKSKPLN